MADDEQFSLCWNNFNSNLSAGFHESLIRGDLVDVTLAAEGQFVKAHRLVLSVCSPYFRKMFTQMPANQHAFVFLKDVSHTALKDLIQFMYCGEVNVKQEALPAFISTAEALQIKGLTDSEPATQAPAEPATVIPTTQIHNVSAPQRQRQRTTTRTYKLETVDDTDDDQPQQQQQSHHHQTSPSKIQATQIVIQTAAPTSTSSTQQQQQQQHLQQVVQQGNVQHATATTSGTSTQKRPLRGSGGPSLKRTKNTSTTTSTTLVDPLETANETITSQPQITVQAAIVNTMASSKEGTSTTETAEYIDLPLELPSTKSEPDYADEAGDNDNDQDGAYVEDDAYGEMRYDESYFTEGEEGNATGTGNTTTAVVSKSDIKQSGSFTDSFAAGETGDQGNNDTQGAAAIWYSTTTLANLLDGRFYQNIQLIPDLPDTVQATCTACASIICDKTTSTSNFIKHIKRKHADVLQSIKWKDCRSTSLPKILDGKFYRNIQPNKKTPGGIQATCTACFGVISGTPKSTGNFISHIRRRHKDIFENCKWYCQTKGLHTWPTTDPKPWTWS